MDYLEKVLSQAGLPPKIAFDMTRNDWVSGLGEVFDSVVLGTKVFIKPLSYIYICFSYTIIRNE